jgi:hypothetical protein
MPDKLMKRQLVIRSVSLDAELALWAEQQAADESRSVSNYVNTLLSRLRQNARRRLRARQRAASAILAGFPARASAPEQGGEGLAALQEQPAGSASLPVVDVTHVRQARARRTGATQGGRRRRATHSCDHAAGDAATRTGCPITADPAALLKALRECDRDDSLPPPAALVTPHFEARILSLQPTPPQIP